MQHPYFEMVRNPLNAIAFVVAFLGITIRVIGGEGIFFGFAFFGFVYVNFGDAYIFLVFREKSDAQAEREIKNSQDFDSLLDLSG